MNYIYCITKKRFKDTGLDGYFNIPYNTICELKHNIVHYQNRQVCMYNSKQWEEYFYGYDVLKPQEDLQRQKNIEQIKKYCPKLDSEESLLKWGRYGKIVNMMGFQVWQWDIEDLNISQTKYILNELKKEGIK